MQRRAVGELGVVERQHQRLGLSKVGSQPIEPVAEREADVARGSGGCPGVVRRVLALRLDPEQRPRETGSPGQQLLAPRRIGACDRDLEQLPGHAEGELALELVPARIQHLHPCLARKAPRVCEQRALADARRAFDQHDPAAAGARVSDRSLQQP